MEFVSREVQSMCREYPSPKPAIDASISMRSCFSPFVSDARATAAA